MSAQRQSPSKFGMVKRGLELAQIGRAALNWRKATDAKSRQAAEVAMVADPHVALRRFVPKAKTFNAGQRITNIARQNGDARALGHRRRYGRACRAPRARVRACAPGASW